MTPAAWILSLLLALPAPAPMPGWEESSEQRTSRLTRIASEIATTVYGAPGVPAEPSLTAGLDASAARLVAVAYMESGFAADVYAGRCYRGRTGRGPRCDGGLSHSIFQLRIGTGATREGWRAADLAAEPRRAVVVALRMMRGSEGCARRYGAGTELAAYASGRCSHGHGASRARMALAWRLLAEHPRPGPVVLPLLPGGARAAPAP